MAQEPVILNIYDMVIIDYFVLMLCLYLALPGVESSWDTRCYVDPLIGIHLLFHFVDFCYSSMLS